MKAEINEENVLNCVQTLTNEKNPDSGAGRIKLANFIKKEKKKKH